ncbi:hypothetical protein QQM39_25605 [Streptomyces sp. DT2A-34]|uniref:hypothetical protein n=1 Tax=Streptomyces sp. DT2A-34 TaxID=3051182 RepID=UPI00265B99C1|nr:hypothetical protein [Streptomyces sp. DT2A-34]MDO0914086.1 hypothetical protein [Streptomyces sp. DT2A-34]
MSEQPEHGGWGTMPVPEIRTVDDLRSALSRYGFPGDRERFEGGAGGGHRSLADQ